MGRILINGSSSITFAEVPYIKLQRVPDFILDVLGNTLNDDTKTAILDQDQFGLHSWVRRNLDTLVKAKRLKATGSLVGYWDDYLAVFAKKGPSAPETRAALTKFQTAACLGGSYMQLPSAANLAEFYEKKSDVTLPMATAQEIRDKKGVPNYGNYIEGKISDMVAAYQQMVVNRRVAAPVHRVDVQIGGHR